MNSNDSSKTTRAVSTLKLISSEFNTLYICCQSKMIELKPQIYSVINISYAASLETTNISGTGTRYSKLLDHPNINLIKVLEGHINEHQIYDFESIVDGMGVGQLSEQQYEQICEESLEPHIIHEALESTLGPSRYGPFWVSILLTIAYSTILLVGGVGNASSLAATVSALLNSN